MTDSNAPENKIAAAILTMASALRDKQLVSEASQSTLFDYYSRYLEAIKTGKAPAS